MLGATQTPTAGKWFLYGGLLFGCALVSFSLLLPGCSGGESEDKGGSKTALADVEEMQDEAMEAKGLAEAAEAAKYSSDEFQRGGQNFSKAGFISTNFYRE